MEHRELSPGPPDQGFSTSTRIIANPSRCPHEQVISTIRVVLIGRDRSGSVRSRAWAWAVGMSMGWA